MKGTVLNQTIQTAEGVVVAAVEVANEVGLGAVGAAVGTAGEMVKDLVNATLQLGGTHNVSR